MIPFDGNPFGFPRDDNRFLMCSAGVLTGSYPGLTFYCGHRLQGAGANINTELSGVTTVTGELTCKSIIVGSTGLGDKNCAHSVSSYIRFGKNCSITVEYLQCGDTVTGEVYTAVVPAGGLYSDSTAEQQESHIGYVLLGPKAKDSNKILRSASGQLSTLLPDTEIQCFGEYTNCDCTIECNSVTLYGAPRSVIKCKPKLINSHVSLTYTKFPVSLYKGEYGLIDFRDEYTDGSTLAISSTSWYDDFMRAGVVVDEMYYDFFDFSIRLSSGTIKVLHVLSPLVRMNGASIGTLNAYGDVLEHYDYAYGNIEVFNDLPDSNGDYGGIPYGVTIDTYNTGMKKIEITNNTINVKTLNFTNSLGDNRLEVLTTNTSGIRIETINGCQRLRLTSGRYTNWGPVSGLLSVEIIPVRYGTLNWQIPSGLELVTLEPALNYGFQEQSSFDLLSNDAIKVYARPYTTFYSYSFSSLQAGAVIDFKIDISSAATMLAYLLSRTAGSHDFLTDNYYILWEGSDVKIEPNVDYPWGRLDVTSTTVRLRLNAPFTV